MREKRLLLSIILLTTVSCSLYAENVTVRSWAALKTAIGRSSAGDVITVANGTYRSTEEIKVQNKKGTATRPIVIQAETIGGVTITGEGSFDLQNECRYITIKGFVFKCKSQIGNPNNASFCTYTRNVYACTHNKDAGERRGTSYLIIRGANNEISYNTFMDKDFVGPMLSLQGGRVISPNNWVHHNHFKNFLTSNTDNNNTAVQPGYGQYGNSKANMIIEHNLFENLIADGEGVLSVKCWDVKFRYNTIVDCATTSIRSGQETHIYGNYFVNSNVRFADSNHKMYNNVLYGPRSGIILFSRLSSEHETGYSHVRPVNCFVGHNTFVKSRIGFRSNGDGGSQNLRVVNNIFYDCAKAVEDAGAPMDGVLFAGNMFWKGNRADHPARGIVNQDPKFSFDENDIPQLKAGSPAIDKAVGSYNFVLDDQDGQTRSGIKDIGSDEFSSQNKTVKFLNVSDVGPNAATTKVNTAPTGSFVQPMVRTVEEGYTSLSFEVNASDAEADEITLVLSIDGTELRSEGIAPYEWGHTSGNPATSAELLGLAVGDHEFKVVITDSKGASSTIRTIVTVLEQGRSIYSPIHDAYVEGINGKNDGVLRLEEGRRKSYLQFELSSIPAGFEIVEAKLQLTVDTDFGNGTIRVYNSTNNNWTEGSIEQNNAPSRGQELSRLSGPFETGKTYNLDVLGYVTQNGKVTFILESNGTGADDVSFASKENTTYAQPVLSVKVDRVTNIAGSDFEAFYVFPNPSDDGVFRLSTKIEWEVLDVKGLPVLKGKSNSVNLSGQRAGVYFLKTEGTRFKLVKGQ